MKIHNFVPDLMQDLADYQSETGNKPSKIVARRDVVDSIRVYTRIEFGDHNQYPIVVSFAGIPIEVGNTLFPYIFKDKNE